MTLQVGDKYHVQCQPPNTSVGSSEGHHRVISGYGNVSQKLNCLRITRSFKGAQDFEVLEAAWVHEYVPSQVFSSISEVRSARDFQKLPLLEPRDWNYSRLHRY